MPVAGARWRWYRYAAVRIGDAVGDLTVFAFNWIAEGRSVMPTTTCPRCKRGISFEMHEMHTVFECASCRCKFTHLSGAVDDARQSPNQSVQKVHASLNTMLRFLCPRCGKRLKAPETATGRTTKCPKCGTALGVPATSSRAAAP